MPKNYKQGELYELRCRKTGRVSVGSTAEGLDVRMSNHLGLYKSWKEGKSKYNCAFDIIDSGDYNEKVIEQYPCECDVDVCTSDECKRRLCRREGEYIRQYRDEYGELCVNKAIAGRTKREWEKDNPDKVKQYETAPARQASLKEYKDSGRKAEVNKLWRDNHTEYIAQQNKEWREKNDERLKEKVACDKCGQLIVFGFLKKHQKLRSCNKVSRSDVIPCSLCDTLVTKRKMKRHQETAKCKRKQSEKNNI